MLLTVSKRLEFSASRCLRAAGRSESENLALFGPETSARHGSGRNYTAYFVFTGAVHPVTGMLINISQIKERAGKVVRERFDPRRPLRRTLPGNSISMWLRRFPMWTQNYAPATFLNRPIAAPRITP